MSCFGLFSDQFESRILFQTNTMSLEPDHKASVTQLRLLGVDKIASNRSVQLKPGVQQTAKINQPGPNTVCPTLGVKVGG